jgi:hypothetical protein
MNNGTTTRGGGGGGDERSSTMSVELQSHSVAASATSRSGGGGGDDRCCRDTADSGNMQYNSSVSTDSNGTSASMFQQLLAAMSLDSEGQRVTSQEGSCDNDAARTTASVQTITLSGLEYSNLKVDRSMFSGLDEAPPLTWTSTTPHHENNYGPSSIDMAYPNLAHQRYHQSLLPPPPPTWRNEQDRKPPPPPPRPLHPSPNHAATTAAASAVHGYNHQYVQEHFSSSLQLDDLTNQFNELERAVQRARAFGDEQTARSLAQEQATIRLLLNEAAMLRQTHAPFIATTATHHFGSSPPLPVPIFVQITNKPPSDPTAHGHVDHISSDRPDTLYFLNLENQCTSLSCYQDFKQYHQLFKRMELLDRSQPRHKHKELNRDQQKIVAHLIRRYGEVHNTQRQMSNLQTVIKVAHFMLQECFVDFDGSRDVLKGQGGHGQHNPGNQFYIAQRNALLPQYSATAMGDDCAKDRLAEALVQSVYANGGRFVKRCTRTQQYYVQEHAKVVKQAKQAFIDKCNGR